MARERWLDAALLSMVVACSNRERPPDVTSLVSPPAEAGPADAVIERGIVLDGGTPERNPVPCTVALETGSCACSEVGQKPTSVYLVLDRSGSMQQTWPPSGRRTWDLVRLALLDNRRGVLRALGSRIAVGAAVFPQHVEACLPGEQVFPLTAGSDDAYARLAKILEFEAPAGLTPTASTLESLMPTLLALPKPAYVLLATDGAPNCGSTPCEAARCSYNIEKVGGCEGLVNCCDPTQVSGGQGVKACVDSSATQRAVATIADAGIPVFVLGAPGTEAYAAELNLMAEAGGTARQGDQDAGADAGPKYYAATSATQEALEEALKAIASKVVESCQVTLDTQGTDPDTTNVLLDGVAVTQGGVDGWSWISSDTVRLNGRACARIEAGSVTRVQVVVGCRTLLL